MVIHLIRAIPLGHRAQGEGKSVQVSRDLSAVVPLSHGRPRTERLGLSPTGKAVVFCLSG